ncbi:hypothetical protein HY024_05270 [Candidatus Curtissbacteria bacterium]|nr:hypothetical protein [Candidatus Curtissbacteria bacterium]
MAKSEKALIILDGTSVLYYSKKLEKFSFPGNSVADLEIIDSVLLENSFRQFIHDKAITPSHLLIILSPNITFTKKLSEGEGREAMKREFLETVPFSNLIWKIYLSNKKTTLVVGNKNFCEAFKLLFERAGFTVEAITPQAALPETLNELRENNLDSLLKKPAILTNLNLEVPAHNENHRLQNEAQKQFKANKNLRILLPVFLAGLLLLGVSFFIFGRGTPKISRPPTQLISAKTPLPDINNPETLQIQISYTTPSEETARNLKNTYWSVGFKNTDTIVTSSAQKTEIIFPSTINEDIKKQLKNELAKIDPQFTEGIGTENKVLIMLSASLGKKLIP